MSDPARTALLPDPVGRRRGKPAHRAPRRARPVGGDGTRLVALDGLRFLAALGVVWFHYLWHSVPEWGARFGVAHDAAQYGYLGVNLFFLISGFVICMSTWGRSLGEFFVSRVVRLYPAYWVGIALTTLVVSLAGSADLRGEQVLVNLTMLQHAFGFPDVDPSYWTLWRELSFYVIFALVVWRGVTYRRVVWFCLLWTLACLISAAAAEPLLEVAVGAHYDTYLGDYSMYFVAGTAMFLMHRFGANALLWAIVLGSWLLAMHRLRADHPAAAITTGCFLLVLVVALGWLDRVRWRWLTVVGSLTYPLYLIHQSIGSVVITRLADKLPPALLLVAVTVAMLGLAFALHRLVERPLAARMKRSLRRALARLSEARPAAHEAATPARIAQAD